MNHIVSNLLLVVALISAAVATDYCSTSLCSSGVPHIGCGHSGALAGTCPATAAMGTLTPALKQLILDAHNEKRNLVASGSDPNHDAACRLATMQWDDELASLAALNVKQCEMKHDRCRNTDTFRYSGQNLAWMGYFGAIDHNARLQQAVDMWFDEIKDSNMNYIDSYPSNYQGPAIGHFTVMSAEKNTHVGCAVLTYPPAGASYNAYLVACNYATTNMIGHKIYSACTTPGEGCSTGTNPTYPNLCSTAETYAVNTWF